MNTRHLKFLPICLAAVMAAGCASKPDAEVRADAMVAAPPAPLPQAPSAPGQEVRQPAPPPQISGPAEGSGTRSQDQAGPYLRLDSGWSFAANGDLSDSDPGSADCVLQGGGGTYPDYSSTCTGSLDDLGSSWIIGVGVGWRFPGGIRADVSFSSRSGYDLSGRDAAGTDFDPQVKATTYMASVYYDFPQDFAGWRPYAGAGIGISRNKMDPLNWSDAGCCSGTLPGGSETSTAWHLSVGAHYALVDKWVLDIGYRYLDMGDFAKDAGPDIEGLFGTGVTGAMKGSLKASELQLGLLYNF